MFSDVTSSKPSESQNTLTSPYLSWKDRTPEINQCISKAFQGLADKPQSKWGAYNGKETYGIGNIKEHKLLRKIIRKAPPENKDFYVLDIGAGNFQWGRRLADYLNAKTDIPQDITIHIIGIRGENNLDEAVTKLGRCNLYEFGQFQIERLMDEFEQRGLQLANKVDLVISRWCFRHLVDPVGTFTQAYDLLRPQTGHLLLDGFFFLHENEKMEDESLNFNERMIRLCLETRAPFLTRHYNDNHSLDHVVLRKPDDHPCHLQKQYFGTENLEYWKKNWVIGSHHVTQFKDLKENDIETTSLLDEGEYRGDKRIYDWLRQNGLLHNLDSKWGPLQDKDAHKKAPPMHTSIVNGDEEAFYRCLQEGCDINESDDKGFTPLHLTIQHNNYKLFSLLLEMGALTKVFANVYTPLHWAILYDMEGCFIRDLITAGADVNIIRSTFTPLSFALDLCNNVKGVELLLAAKANVSYSDHQILQRYSKYSSMQYILPKKLSELEGFDTIIDHIKKRGRVFLIYPNRSYGRIFKPTRFVEDSKLIQVTVNPKTLLLDGNNYKEIEGSFRGDNSFDYDESCITEIVDRKGIVPDLELRFGY